MNPTYFSKKINCLSYFISILLVLVLFGSSLPAQISVVTQHNDLGRTGWNNKEIILNTKNVKPGSFGKLFTRPIDDQLFAQLLVKSSVSIPGVGLRNIVYAATSGNSVYAYDADSANRSSPYWQVNLTPSGLRPVKSTDFTGACGGNYRDIIGNAGIIGTPVIDSVTNTLYLVARSCASDGTGFVQYLHALDLATGNEKTNSPKLITAQIAGAGGSGNIAGIIYFDAERENQRAGLLLLNGEVYITYASHCDWGPYHGWILGYDATTLNQNIVYNSTPNGYNGGIWMSGAAPSADSAGNIYVSVGNGSAGYGGDLTDIRNRSESSLKLAPSGSTLSVQSWFTPYTYQTLENSDLDFGVTQFMLIPHTHQGATASKDGKLYLIDKDNMGGYNASSNNIVQTINLATNAHLRSSLSYYIGNQKEFMYSWSENALLKAFPYNRSTNMFDLANTVSSGAQGPVGNIGALLCVSSNGSEDSTAVLWAAFAATGDANQSIRPGILYAFEASDVTKELWNSSLVSSDSVGNYAKFNNPTIVNGKVYLATFSNQFIVYGLTGQPADLCNTPNIALNKTATASSSENSTNIPANAFDGDPATRWASAGGSDSQYIYVDLGADYDLCNVVLQWETALGKDFSIDVSEDHINWTTLQSITNNTGFVNYIGVNGMGRYVRMNGTKRGSPYGYSLYSFDVYGTLSKGDCPASDSLYVTDIYENSAILHWKATGAPNYNIQYKAVTAANWTIVSADTNMIMVNDLACGTDYLYKVQSACSAIDTSVYSVTSSFSQLACGSNCSPLPTRWSTQDIGSTDIPGSACYTPDIYTLHGSGNDIGGNADAFRFAFKTLAGDGEFNARVLTLDSSNALNKCGIMIRETLATGSKNVFIALTSESGALFQTRTNTDGTTTQNAINTTGVVSPYFIKLIKTGSVYSAFISADGNSFTGIGTPVDAGFGNGVPVYAGLALTSHDNSILSTATVDKYVFTSGVLPVKLINFNAGLTLSHKVDLKWSTTQQMNTSYFVIERSSADYKFSAIDTVKVLNNGSFATAYTKTDNAPLNGINFYRLKIVDIDGNFTYSALAMIRLNNSKAPVIYPNPAKSFININQGSEIIKYVTIYNISGKAITRIKYPLAGNVSQLSTTNLSKGTYLVEITTEANIYRDKLVIQ